MRHAPPAANCARGYRLCMEGMWCLHTSHEPHACFTVCCLLRCRPVRRHALCSAQNGATPTHGTPERWSALLDKPLNNMISCVACDIRPTQLSFTRCTLLAETAAQNKSSAKTGRHTRRPRQQMPIARLVRIRGKACIDPPSGHERPCLQKRSQSGLSDHEAIIRGCTKQLRSSVASCTDKSIARFVFCFPPASMAVLAARGQAASPG